MAPAKLARGVNKHSRGVMYGKNQRYKYAPGGPKYKKQAKKVVAAVVEKASRFYPGEDIAKPMKSRKPNKQTKLKAGYTAGTVLIVLSGRFRGKRVVFLKQLDSGLLLVTGPYKVNGVPLRRMNQAYTIATSTTISLEGVVTKDINDDFFKKQTSGKKQDEEEFFAQGGEAKVEISAERKAAQKAVDTALSKTIAATPLLKHYLNAKFTLTRGQCPHEMKF